jgi:hypothetical protein
MRLLSAPMPRLTARVSVAPINPSGWVVRSARRTPRLTVRVDVLKLYIIMHILQGGPKVTPSLVNIWYSNHKVAQETSASLGF